ncbi:MAG: acyl-CoA dehydrogenase family protein, partial [Myxococcota bacterium]|nr:acyl-CoA dehydrogenase family protein [Myxococcota bacterium]
MSNQTAEEFYQEVESFAQTEVAPGAEAREKAGEIDHALIKKMGSRGLLAVNVSKELGGEGAGVVAYANAVKRIAEADASIAVTMAVTNMVGEVIQQFGTDAQKKHYCPKLASGEFFAGAFALSEPGSGSDAASLQTKAIREGDDWVISGQKMWITSGTEAGVFVVWAR